MTERNPRAHKLLLALAKFVFVLVAACGVWQVIYYCFIGRGQGANKLEFAQNGVLPVLVLGLICMIATRHHLHWSKPLRKLSMIVPQIRDGEVPIEELSNIRGPEELKELARITEMLLRDLRLSRAQLAELNEEMRQRVERRTTALERTVGSLRHQATRDPLTGLNNRRTLDLSIEEMIQSCRATKADLALLMFDVDNFKKLNDTLGHACGDQFLRDIGGLIRSTIRSSDLGFRMGGDEFLVLMPDASHAAATALSARLTQLVDENAKTLKVEPKPRVSIGLSMLSAQSDATPAKLIEAADKLLYAIKSSRKFSKGKSPDSRSTAA